jgi:hypothetical protein
MQYGGSEPIFAMVVVNSTGVVISLQQHVLGYVTVGTDQVVYVDEGGNLGRVALRGGTPATIAIKAPAAKIAELVEDRLGRIWFAAEGYKMVGVGRLDLTSGAITIFPLPVATAGSGPAPPCGGAICVPPDAVFDPGIQAITVDDLNNLWLITRVSGSSSGEPTSVMSPVFELLAGP